MERAYMTGMFYFQVREYHAAAEFFAESYRNGYKREDSLYYHGKCLFLEATFQLKGMGSFRRRSVLISAARALEDRLKLFGRDYYTVAELCGVEYALGLLLNSKNGHTPNFKMYFDTLEKGDPEQAHAVQDYLFTLDREFRE